MNDRPPPDVEQLLRHARWVRALACRLVADPGRADDIVQDTWVAALEHGPREEHSIRAWLGRVVANFAFQQRRSEGARTRREHCVASPEPLPSVAEMAARAELERKLVSEVLALDEPYRSTVLYCYFENRSAVEVARELGVPTSTVRNRLKRALELLRARLGAEERASWQWCLGGALTPAVTGGTATSSGTSITGALSMALKAKLVVTLASAAVITGGVLLWRELDHEPGASATSHDSAALDHAPPEAPDTRDSMTVPEIAAVDNLGSPRRTRVTTVSVSEIPVHGSLVISVRFIDHNGASVTRPLPERQQSPWILGLDETLCAIATRDPPTALAPVTELRLVGNYTPAGRPLPGTRLHVPGVPAGCAGVIELQEPLPAYVSSVLDGIVLETQVVDATTREVTFVIAHDDLVARTSTLRFRLLSEDGSAIEKAGIALLPIAARLHANPVMSPLPEGVCDRDGLPSGTYQMQIRVPGREHVNRVIALAPGQVTDLGSITVRDGALLGVNVVDENGAPVSLPVEWARASERTRPCYMPPVGSGAPADRFFEAELPRDGVLLRIADPAWAVNPIVVDTSAERTDGITLIARQGTQVTIRVRAPERACELRLLDSTGLEIWRELVVEAGTLTVRVLPGSYELVRRVGANEQRLQEVAVETTPIAVDVGN